VIGSPRSTWGDGEGPPTGRRPPPWWMDRQDRVGIIDETGGPFSADEWRVADLLRRQGNNVRKVAAASHSTPDAELNPERTAVDHRVELKRPRKRLLGDAAESVRRLVRDAVDRDVLQAPNVVVDLRGFRDASGNPLPRSVAIDAHDRIARVHRRWKHRLDYVRILGDHFDLTFGPYR